MKKTTKTNQEGNWNNMFWCNSKPY